MAKRFGHIWVIFGKGRYTPRWVDTGTTFRNRQGIAGRGAPLFVVRIGRFLVLIYRWFFPNTDPRHHWAREFSESKRRNDENLKQVVEGLQDIGCVSVTKYARDLLLIDSDFFGEIYDGLMPLFIQNKNEEALRFYVTKIREFAEDYPEYLASAHWDIDALGNPLLGDEIDWDNLEKSQDVYLLPLAELEEELGC